MILAKPLPDEFSAGHSGRLWKLNGSTNAEMFSSLIASYLNLPKTRNAYDVIDVCHTLNIPWQTYARQHTLTPIFGMFRSADINAENRRFPMSHDAQYVGTGSLTPLKKSAWYCMACIADDTAQHGVPYWHRFHQLPGAVECPIHGERLRATHRKKFYAPPNVSPKDSVAKYDGKTLAVLQRVASTLEQTALCHADCVGSGDLTEYAERIFLEARDNGCNALAEIASLDHEALEEHFGLSSANTTKVFPERAHHASGLSQSGLLGNGHMTLLISACVERDPDEIARVVTSLIPQAEPESRRLHDVAISAPFPRAPVHKHTAAYGQSVRDVALEFVEAYGNAAEAARHLGLRYGLVARWWREARRA